MNDFEMIRDRCLREIKQYADGRKSDVARGLETSRLAALLLEKFSLGMAAAFNQFDGEFKTIANDIIKLSDKLCDEIDQDFEQNKTDRWAARPADLKI